MCKRRTNSGTVVGLKPVRFEVVCFQGLGSSSGVQSVISKRQSQGGVTRQFIVRLPWEESGPPSGAPGENGCLQLVGARAEGGPLSGCPIHRLVLSSRFSFPLRTLSSLAGIA